MPYPVECFLVDDDIDDQEIFSLALQELGPSIRCVVANDGIQALKKLNDDHSFIPDYIFMDVNMPRMNGIQCLAEIKKTPHIRHVPVYIYSTSADPEMMTKSKLLGAADFIVKPPSITLLSQTLAQLFERKRKDP